VEGITRGLLLVQRGDYARAVRALAACRGRDGLPARLGRFYEALARRALGLRCLQKGQYEDARGHFRAAGELGLDADLSVHLARSNRLRDRRRSVAQAERRLAERPDDPRRHRALARALWRAGRREDAELALRAALRRLGPDAGLLVQLGLFRAAADDLPAARQAFEQALDADCGDADAHKHLGLVLAAQQQPAAALARLQRAFALRPWDLRLAEQLALAARAAREQGAEVVLQLPRLTEPPPAGRVGPLATYVADEPELIDALLPTTRAEGNRPLLERLWAAVELALAERPNQAGLHRRAARVLRRLGAPGAALAHARRAVELAPACHATLRLAAELLALHGRETEAVAAYRRAIAAGADFPDVHVRVAALLRGLGQMEAARAHLRAALTLKADYPAAARALASLAA
jgi:tetratricopeptide (TPR) repeat protein